MSDSASKSTYAAAAKRGRCSSAAPASRATTCVGVWRKPRAQLSAQRGLKAGATVRLGRGGDQEGGGDPRQGAGARGAQGLSPRAHLLRERPAVALIDAGGGV